MVTIYITQMYLLPLKQKGKNWFSFYAQCSKRTIERQLHGSIIFKLQKWKDTR